MHVDKILFAIVLVIFVVDVLVLIVWEVLGLPFSFAFAVVAILAMVCLLDLARG